MANCVIYVCASGSAQLLWPRPKRHNSRLTCACPRKRSVTEGDPHFNYHPQTFAPKMFCCDTGPTMKVKCHLGRGLWGARGHGQATAIPGAKHAEHLSCHLLEDPITWNLFIVFISLLRVAHHLKITLHVARCTTRNRTKTLIFQWSFFTSEMSLRSLPNSDVK